MAHLDTGDPQGPRQLLLTPEEAARTLRISRSLVYVLLAQGRLGSVRIGRARRVPVVALERFVADLHEGLGNGPVTDS